MPLKAMPRLTSSTPDLTRALGLVKAAVDPLLQAPTAGAVWVQGIVLPTPTVPVQVPHGLGRPWQGFIVTHAAPDAASTTFLPYACDVVQGYANYDSSQFIQLVADLASGTLDILVF